VPQTKRRNTPSQYWITSLRLHAVGLEIDFEVGELLGSNQLATVTLRGKSVTNAIDAK
jgi:hypothetical protein